MCYLQRALQQHAVHGRLTFKLLAGVHTASVAAVHTLAAVAVAAITVALGDVVVVVVAEAAVLPPAGEGGGGVDQEEAAARLHVFLHGVHDGWRGRRRRDRRLDHKRHQKV